METVFSELLLVYIPLELVKFSSPVLTPGTFFLSLYSRIGDVFARPVYLLPLNSGGSL